MTQAIQGFAHRFVPAEPGGPAPVLLLLHGTGGDEDDLLPLGRLLWPGAALLSPRGQVAERGASRFFRRMAEGVFDIEDLHRRTDELARFIAEAAERYAFDGTDVVAVGFSNGANVAASLLLSHPSALRGAVLFRAMVPFEPEAAEGLAGVPVLLGAGRFDPIVPAPQVDRLSALLREAGAAVTLDWQPAGHALTRPDVERARRWLAESLPVRR